MRPSDWADAHREFDREGIQFWLDYELEALRYGVDPDVSREELAALVEGSKVLLAREEHRVGHCQANDFARRGRSGGLVNLRRYGTSWFSLLKTPLRSSWPPNREPERPKTVTSGKSSRSRDG